MIISTIQVVILYSLRPLDHIFFITKKIKSTFITREIKFNVQMFNIFLRLFFHFFLFFISFFPLLLLPVILSVMFLYFENTVTMTLTTIIILFLFIVLYVLFITHMNRVMAFFLVGGKFLAIHFTLTVQKKGHKKSF